MSACLLQPLVALRFRRAEQSVEALVCFECGELICEDERGRALSGRMMLGGERGALLRAAKQAFPLDRTLQAIEE
jgi:hypothetical protein